MKKANKKDYDLWSYWIKTNFSDRLTLSDFEIEEKCPGNSWHPENSHRSMSSVENIYYNRVLGFNTLTNIGYEKLLNKIPESIQKLLNELSNLNSFLVYIMADTAYDILCNDIKPDIWNICLIKINRNLTDSIIGNIILGCGIKQKKATRSLYRIDGIYETEDKEIINISSLEEYAEENCDKLIQCPISDNEDDYDIAGIPTIH